MITPDISIVATEPYKPPLIWYHRLLRGVSFVSVPAGAAASLWLHDPAPVLITCLPAMVGLLYVLKHTDDVKHQDKTDVDVHAVVGANAIQCTPRWGVYRKMIVKIRGTRPFEHERDELDRKAQEELTRMLAGGFCEVSDLQPTNTPGIYTAHVSIRSAFPDKNGHHKHTDLAHHLLRKGWLTIDKSESVTQTFERCVAEAKAKGAGAWGYFK
ncbi:MAG: hypothetical protein BWK73_26805 [Thiothrix lacustris]|uniref:TNase-like domain-containing protein n=1 Tax=Thiothrix lacustris TaxID=525917 RepID=A0A1Y1QKY4_9GAMM|nr:MAG: hypothetical protein BWK73_26805 [Thiothrix lacustris]